jgi:ATP-dependent Clp protease ATP-binding subunit ClpA
MFERLTERARTVVVLAQAEASRLGHGWIGTEHLLLGVAAEREGLGGRLLADAGLSLDGLRSAIVEKIGRPQSFDADALATIGIDLEAVRDAVEQAFGPGALDRTRAGRRPFTPRAKKVLELALREARDFGHDLIGTEHLLIGLARGEGFAAELLLERGLTLERTRALVREALAAA